MHKTGCVEINKVPTSVETWGRWIEDKPSKQNEDIILVIPGNPGVTGYYRTFLETIYKKLKCPVWIIGHSGHQKLSIDVPSLSGNEKLYDLHGQSDHKVQFFRKYVPDGARVHLIGHSVGAYICLQMLQHPDIKSRVTKSYLLFPTLENIVDTPNGKFLTGVIKYILWIIYFLAFIFTCLPHVIRINLLLGYFKLTGVPSRKARVTMDFIHPEVLQKVFFMAFDEMKLICELSSSMIEPNVKQLKLYYGLYDNWAPISHFKNMKLRYPDIDGEICSRKFHHAFVLRSSVDMANLIATWVQLEN